MLIAIKGIQTFHVFSFCRVSLSNETPFSNFVCSLHESIKQFSWQIYYMLLIITAASSTWEGFFL